MTWKELFAEAVRIAADKDYLTTYLENMIERQNEDIDSYYQKVWDTFNTEFEKFFNESY